VPETNRASRFAKIDSSVIDLVMVPETNKPLNFTNLT
jgi:hypothetical protein